MIETAPLVGYQLETGAKWALLIGVSDYPISRGHAPLPWSRADVDAVAGVLRRGPTPYHVRRLADDADVAHRPTLANMKVEARRLARLARPDDLLLFYFSGHGQATADGETWLVPVDGHRAAPEETALSLRWLRDALAESRAAVRVIVVDALIDDNYFCRWRQLPRAPNGLSSSLAVPAEKDLELP